MKCKCGFKFSGPGEFRNCRTYLDKKRRWILICPDCGREYTED